MREIASHRPRNFSIRDREPVLPSNLERFLGPMPFRKKWRQNARQRAYKALQLGRCIRE